MSIYSGLKRALVGKRLATQEIGQTLLPKRLALPVFASDALSSVAYAPGEILIVLSLAGMAAYQFTWQVGLAVALVVLVVVLSYRQTVHAYPNGGGVYEVARANFGSKISLTAASALLVDYSLTVAVSVAAGVANAEAMISAIRGHEVPVALVVIALLTLMNIRGVRGSAWFFAWPTYIFLFSTLAMVVTGFIRIVVMEQRLHAETADLVVVPPAGNEHLTTWLLIAVLVRAFAAGCAALTGVEAISNGVPAFREPRSKNAASILAMLGVIAITLLMGILVLASLTKVRLIDELMGSHYEDQYGNVIHTSGSTVIGQLARVVFYDFAPVMFFVTVAATVVILFMAANTAFAGFPGLTSILARDGYAPKQLHSRGDRLSYTNGILLLSALSAGLVIAFQASVTALIQLYVVGVFISFSIGQVGMVRHWNRELRSNTDPKQRAKMKRSRVVNAVGAALTSVVLLAILISKFVHGAWIALAMMAVLYLLMRAIKKHYLAVSREVALSDEDHTLPSRVRSVVLVSALNKPTVRALEYAKASHPTHLSAVTVTVEPEETEALTEQWDEEGFDIPLTVLASPYREVTTPFVSYIDQLRTQNPRDVVAVYIPEYVVGHWWEQMLHNQTALMIRARLHFMSGVMVISVPYQLSSSARAKQRVRAISQPRKDAWR